MLQNIREAFRKSAMRSMAKSHPGFDSFYQTYRVPAYSMISVFGDIDGDHDKVLRRYVRAS